MNRVNYHKYSIIILLLSLIMFSCSGKPSESNAKTVVENMFKQAPFMDHADVKIISFKKINSEDKTIEGTPAYLLDYTAEITTSKSGVFSYSTRPWQGDTFALWNESKEKEGFYRSMSENATWIAAGEKFTFLSKILFIKTEKGWRGQDGNIY